MGKKGNHIWGEKREVYFFRLRNRNCVWEKNGEVCVGV